VSAKVKPNPYGGWIGYCPEHNETIAGSMATVDLWADMHNAQDHQEDKE
jgi:hypothetical protein